MGPTCQGHMGLWGYLCDHPTATNDSNIDSMILHIDFYYAYGCFVYVCVPHACLAPAEVRRGIGVRDYKPSHGCWEPNLVHL